jgi:hypothetical protein
MTLNLKRHIKGAPTTSKTQWLKPPQLQYLLFNYPSQPLCPLHSLKMFPRNVLALFYALIALSVLAVATPNPMPNNPPPVTVTVTATAPASTVTTASQCSTGDLQCCQSVQQVSLFSEVL